jgi:hypothetical protein
MYDLAKLRTKNVKVISAATTGFGWKPQRGKNQ